MIDVFFIRFESNVVLDRSISFVNIGFINSFNMDDVVVSINVKFFFFGGGFDGIFGFENFVKFFKLEYMVVLVIYYLVKIGDFIYSVVFGFGDEEVEDCSLDEVLIVEDDVGFLRDVFKCDWDIELCGEKGDGGKEG